MKQFKSTGKYWFLLMIISTLMMVLAYRGICNGTITNLFSVYGVAIGDVVVIGLIVPVVSLLLLKVINDCMLSSRMLAFGSRSAWWQTVKKKIRKQCLGSGVLLLLPVFLMANVTMKIQTIVEWIYILFLFFTIFMFFYLIALCIAFMEIKFQQNTLTFCFVMFLSYLPDIAAFLFRQTGIPQISGCLNLSYAFDGKNFYWFQCEKVCVVMLLLLLLLENTCRVLVKKHNIFWKM